MYHSGMTVGVEARSPSSRAASALRTPAFRLGIRIFRSNRFAVALMLLAVVAGLATYAALSEAPPFGHRPGLASVLLNLNLVILLLLLAVIARKLVALWARRRQGRAGSRLHLRLVAMFSSIAAVPVVVVATFSALFFHLGVQSWFAERVSTALDASVEVAQEYLREHQATLRADALTISIDLNDNSARLSVEPRLLDQVLTSHAIVRNLTEAVVYTGGDLFARSALSLAVQFESLPDDAFTAAAEGEVVLLDSATDDRVRALIRLDRFADSYLLIGRFVEAKVIGYMERTEAAVEEYQLLEGRRSELQLTFTLVYVVVALLLLMVAVWVSLLFADGIVRPISDLIAAAERVREGDLQARVARVGAGDEIGLLSRAFNRMTAQLQTQRQALVSTNEELDQRRRFTETVLEGVSAGVIALDGEGRITLPNRSALDFLEQPVDGLIGRPLAEAVPEMAELFATADPRSGRMVEGQVRIRRGGEPRTLLVRIAPETVGGTVDGYVVTFDDISELLSAQRKAAWADVARRIAHEIKNPLTPIQLSAERLKRRYLKQIVDDPDTFVSCTETIVRQVGDIGRMVDEFSAFARMPQPKMEPADLRTLAREAVALQTNAYGGGIAVTLDPAAPSAVVPCDRRQVAQVLTNLLQNAIDAIEGRTDPDAPPGAIRVSLHSRDDHAEIAIEDNGKGLPPDDRDRLTEPYVTTREKGTGLGLAIVKKIMEDHGGRLQLEDAEETGGARVRLLFPWGVDQMLNDDATPADGGATEDGT